MTKTRIYITSGPSEITIAYFVIDNVSLYLKCYFDKYLEPGETSFSFDTTWIENRSFESNNNLIDYIL